MPTSNRDCAERAVVDNGFSFKETATDELARLAKSGNVHAFAALATRLRPRLLVVLSKRLGGQVADAEDIAQDTLTKAWRNIGSYDGNRSFTSWIYTIAIRRSTDYLRHAKRRLHHAQRLTSKASTTESVEQSLIDRETADNIWWTAKRELTDPQYVALWLRYAEEFSVAEIAETMGKTQVAIRVLLHRARAKLHSHFSSESRYHET